MTIFKSVSVDKVIEIVFIRAGENYYLIRGGSLTDGQTEDAAQTPSYGKLKGPN